jgi:cyclic pyranopterin phosphate synthase
MPTGQQAWLGAEQLLSDSELERVVRVGAAQGISKVRLTGGEPMARKNLAELVGRLAALEGVRELCLTTNATLLQHQARRLRQAGLSRMNISLDTLRPERFAALTGTPLLDQVLAGIDQARQAGFDAIKINTVLVRGVNEDEALEFALLACRLSVQVRFIEYMPTGAPTPWVWQAERVVASEEIRRRLQEAGTLEAVDGEGKEHGPERLYRFCPGRLAGSASGASALLGFISPITQPFCGSCNRLRLTADGKLKPCLHSAEEIPVRGLHGRELEEALKTAIWHKPSRHGNLSDTERSEAQRNMNQIGG